VKLIRRRAVLIPPNSGVVKKKLNFGLAYLKMEAMNDKVQMPRCSGSAERRADETFLNRPAANAPARPGGNGRDDLRRQCVK